MRSLVSWCLDRTSVVILATVLVLAGGVFGATQLRQQLFPDIDFPFLIVSVDAPGFDAPTIDEQVGAPVAQAAEEAGDVVSVTTIASDGQLRLYVELDYGTETDAATESLDAALSEVDLPDGVGEPEFAGGFTEQAVVLATLVAQDGDAASLATEADRLVRELEGVEGVGNVEVSGASEPRIAVTLLPAAIERGITSQVVAEGIRATQTRANVGVVVGPGAPPAGVVVEGPDVRDVADLRALELPGLGRLGDIARVEQTDAADAGFALSDGKPAISVSVFREGGGDEVAVVDGALEALARAERRIDGDAVDVIYETASDIRASIKGLVVEGTLGAIFAVVVIFLFLRSIRGTLVAAISIPTSIVFGVLVAWALGLTINIITLAGLTIAIGRVIDDGIVVLENIHSHLERGTGRRRAMVDGTAEVATAIASSTIATAAVFLPIGLVGGLISEIFLSFSIIVTVALLASLLVAVTLVPVVGALVLRTKVAPDGGRADATHEQGGALGRLVEPATRFGIRWRWLVLPVAVATMVGTLALAFGGAIPTQFLPDSGTNQVTGSVQLPPGTSAEQARDLLAPLDRRIGEIDGLESVQLTYGIPSAQAAFDPTIGASTAEFFFTLDEDRDAVRVEGELREFGIEQYPGGFSVQRLVDGPPSGTFQMNLEGDRQEEIAAAAGAITELLRERADRWQLVEIEAQAAQAVPQLLVRTRPGADVAPGAVEAALRAATTPAGAGSVGGTPVTVGSSLRLSADPAAIGALRVPTTAGGGATASLASVASVERVENPAFVNRVDGALSGSITGRLLGEDVSGTTKDIQAAVRELVREQDIDGVRLDFGQGDQAFVEQMFADLGLAMLVAIVLVFFVLVVFFGSVAHPFTILAPILFSFIGSFGALIVTGRALGLPAMIGQLLLIGIIVSNSILLVDATMRLRRAGVARDEALVLAARLRVRPVLMTASATIAALLPLALGISGEGGIISQSLGTVVIGGLLIATLLTLVIVPAVYRILDRDRDMTRVSGDDDPRDDLPASPTTPPVVVPAG